MVQIKCSNNYGYDRKSESSVIKDIIKKNSLNCSDSRILNDRPLQERRELIHYLFTKEEKHVGKEIQLSRMVYHVLQATSFTGNTGEVKNIIKTAVANGLLKSQKDEIIHIHINDLPPKFYKKGANILDDKVMLSVKQLLNKREENHNFYQFHYDIINHLKNNKHSFLK